MNEEERKWLNAAAVYGGGFIKSFTEACFTADESNFEILRPALNNLMVKYPHYLTAPFQKS